MWTSRLGYNFKGGQAFCKGAQVFFFFFFLKLNYLKKKNGPEGPRPPPMFVPSLAKPKGKQKQNKINNNSAIQKSNGQNAKWKTKE